MTDERVNQLRRELCVLVGHSYTRVIAAAALLEHKARSAPNSAEAKAHALLAEARQRMDAWFEAAGADVLGARDRVPPQPARAGGAAAIAGNGGEVPHGGGR
jgi:hypothetical protein